MPRTITFKGNPVTLVGRALKEGDAAPDFRVTAQDLSESGLADFEGKVKIITSFPSLDTPVCDLQVKEFNKRSTSLSPEAVIIGISKDLPFAQKRFCESFEINGVRLLSDYKTSSFGINYGLLIKELNLLARSILIADKNNYLRYIQIVGELTSSADYDLALAALKSVIDNPAVRPEKEEISSHCKPCEGGVPPMPKDKVEKLLAKYRGWELVEDRKLVKEIKFKDFPDAKYFLDLVSVISEEEGHHPVFTLNYNKLKITLTTHAIGGLSENDFIMARAIDDLGYGGLE